MCKCNFLYNLFVICFSILITVTGTNGNISSQSVNNQGLSKGEFMLTKLLNIQIGGESGKPMTGDLRDSIFSEIKGGIKTELKGQTEPLEHAYTPLEDCSHKELLKILNELYSEVTLLKKDVANYSSSEHTIQCDSLDGNGHQLGVNFHDRCHTNVINKLVTGTKKHYPRSCKEVHEEGNSSSGVYKIQPKKSEKPFMVLCDMETRGGGWTHIQKRYDGSVDFSLGWREYKFGFGNLEGEFWLGLENIYKMTGFEINELLVEVVDRENKTAYAHYNSFSVGSESEAYPLSTLKGFSGDAGDSLTPHLSRKFSTKDFDRDGDPRNCPELCTGAWWFTNCHSSNLNGKFLNAALPDEYKWQGMCWVSFRGCANAALAKSRMMIRPIG